MKYIFLSLLSILLISCAVRKKENAVVNDFLEYEMSDKSYDTIFIVREQIDADYAVQLYEWGYKARLNYDSNYGRVWIEPLPSFWPIDIEEIETLKCKSSKTDPRLWKKRDFSNKGFVLINKKERLTIPFLDKHMKTNNHIFFISKPLFSKKGDYAILYYAPTSVAIGPAYPYINEGMKLMKKDGKKWKFVANIKEQVYN